jgi:dipeptidyl aminopeptidase/acylaminoacyl peptidase
MRSFNARDVSPVPGYGRWPSPVTPEALTTGSVGFSDLQVDGEAVLWLESRPDEGGRRALVRWTPEGGARDVLHADANVATRVHEYGGGAYAARHGRIVYSERSDDAVRIVDEHGVRPLAAITDVRYAAFAFDDARGRVYAVREDHRGRPYSDPHNAIVALDLAPADPATNEGTIVFGTTDFVLAPALSPDGARLAFVAYDHPRMPWDASRLIVVELATGEATVVAGANDDESIVECAWSPDGALLFAGDRTGWWNLYAWRDGTTTPLAPLDAEVGRPPWVFGVRSFAPIDAQRILCSAIFDGVVRAGLILRQAQDDRWRPLPFGATDATPLPYGDGAVFVATPPDAPAAVMRARTLHDPAPATLRRASAFVLDAADISVGEILAAPTSGGETTYVTYYAPRNAAVPDPPGLPPLIVMSHGGPTAMHASSYSLGIQWWTTRGLAVAHVNYRGSTGFGRAYRRRLHGAWGVADVEDCIAAADFLVDAGRCDPSKIAIRGGSASGMTALLALARSDRFRTATSLYGVMDLASICVDSHKFELRYTDGLVGPLPEAAAIYRERSPLTYADTIAVPVLLLQGLDDRVVPPDQATAMRDALAARGVPVRYHAFAGEGHGFRRAETIRRALELELELYLDVFGL